MTTITILFAIAAVAFFVVGMSLTLIVKGRHIDSEISTNRHMRERGITCAVKDAAATSSSDDCVAVCGGDDCATCSPEPTAQPGA